MTRRMADACNPANLPPGMDLLASYVDGRCKSDRNDPVRISSLATNAGNVGDCEPGNPRPSVWVAWVRQRRAAGVDPTIYCADDSLSDFFAGYRHRDVRAAFVAAGVPEPHYWLTLPGATTIPPGAVAVQDQLGVDGDRYDLSLVADHWPGVDGGPEVLDPNDPIVQAILIKLDAANGDPNTQETPTNVALFGRLDAIQQSIGQLAQPAVDVNALATALASHPLMATLSNDERDAVAVHVLQHLAKDAAAG